MSLTRFDPVGEFVSLHDAMSRLFQESYVRPNGAAGGAAAVPVDLWETKDGYHVRAELPGLTAEDIEIEATGEGVKISGEFKPDQTIPAEAWVRRERRTGKFQRTFVLPVQIDASRVEAAFQNGVLQLDVPKSEAVKPKIIQVQAKAR